MRALNEGADEDLPIETPRDDWKLIDRDDASYLQRSFDVTPAQAKMLICDIIDAQEHLGHEVRVVIEGSRLTIRTTTHEFGEPTERDRQMTRHIDTAYDEMRQVYR
jgi:pterin-4a-carbinolamine dehydratase